MKICVCYICVARGPVTEDYASRFVTTWHENPPGADCDLLVVSNGGPLPTSVSVLFTGANAMMFPRSNDGWDIGGYIDAARGPCVGYDMMLCLGESNYFHRAGWLARLLEAWNRYGPGMYGPYSSNAVRAHLNTTAFCCSPQILQDYPVSVRTRQDRYEFEHGEHSLWRRTAMRGMPVKLVTWDGAWDPRTWRVADNILWRGDQTNCLMWCNHSDRYVAANGLTRIKWMRSCDRPFK